MPYFLILIVFIADRTSKWWVADYFSVNGSYIEINAYLTLHETYNEGVAFGMFQGIGPFVGWLTIFVVILLFVYLVQMPEKAWIVRYGLALLIGGALGNMVDRIIVGRVLDFVQTPLRSGIFNVADVAINVGMVLVILGSFFHRRLLDNEDQTAVSPEPDEEYNSF